MKKLRVRIPPSPTGKLHLGTARTALFNLLFARSCGGEIVFRWEDTDRERSKPEFETEILDGLKWLGMDFVAESVEFHRQSESAPRHAEILQKLWEIDAIFPCFCPPDEAERLRNSDEKKVFWSPYRETPHAELQSKINAGDRFVWRFRAPRDQKINFHDAVRGEISVCTDTIGDFAVARGDGSVLYLLANAIDDNDQKITHIIRGADGISNTPKQILIFSALRNLQKSESTPEIPQYAHIPLVLDSQKRKLSKRTVEPGTCVLISEFRAIGFLPEAVVNGLAFLGWHPKTTTEEIFTLDELATHFDLSKINPASAQYDFEKMKFFNKKWAQKIGVDALGERFLAWAAEFSPPAVRWAKSPNFSAALALASEKSSVFADLADEFLYLIDDPGLDREKLQNPKFKIDSKKAEKMCVSAVQMLRAIPEENFTRDEIFTATKQKIAELGVKNGEFLHPLRVALSNRERSSAPFEIAEILGKKEAVRRVERGVGG